MISSRQGKEMIYLIAPGSLKVINTFLPSIYILELSQLKSLSFSGSLSLYFHLNLFTIPPFNTKIKYIYKKASKY